MTRTPPPNRRPNLSKDVEWTDPKGMSNCAMTVSVGFCFDSGQPNEVFARAKKPGSVLDALLDEGCRLLSYTLQYGATVPDLRPSFAFDDDGQPLTPLGAVFGVVSEASLGGGEA